MIFDTHSHLNLKAYDNDRDEVIKRTQKQCVVCIDVGTKYETSKLAVQLAEKNKNIYAAIGMHPLEEEKFKYEKYKELALSGSRRVVAIGEIGLDYYYKPKTKIRLDQFKDVIHCFTGTLEEAQEYIKLGFYIGLNGIIFKLNLDEVIKECPLNKILTETDCPYLIPPLARRSPGGEGGRNEPIFIKHVIQKIADLKEMSFDEIAEKTSQNAKRLF